MKNSLKEHAITLIALVVTIIILLILGGVTIGVAMNGSGLFDKAKLATERYQNTIEDENVKTAEYQNEIDSLINSHRDLTEYPNFTLERGTNYYVKKYDSGEMELYGTYSSTMTTSISWGSGYFAPLTTVTFPIAFTNVPYVIPVLSRTGSGNVFSLSLDNTYNDRFTFYPYSMGPTVSNAAYRVDYVAIGTWK